MLESAIAYAAKGWSIFPLQAGTKIPRAGSKGYLDATREVRQIQSWWRESPDYNIGIATGKVSGITVIDVDGQEGIASSKTIAVPSTRVIKTPRGFHLYYAYNPLFSTGAGFLPGMDVRADGGYVVAPPSIVDGKTYSLLRDRDIVVIEITPEEFTARHRNGNTPTPSWVSEALSVGAVEGARNDLATRLAGYFRSKDIPTDIIVEMLTPFANKCSPPLPSDELYIIIQSVGRYSAELATKWDKSRTLSGTELVSGTGGGTLSGTPPQSLSLVIAQWVEESQGWCTADELDRDLGITAVADKENRRKILTRLREQGVIERNPRMNREFRKRDKTLSLMNFRTVKRTGGVDLHWPLGIENLVRLYPGNLVVLAGDGNAGKTALLLNLVRLNMDRFDIHYFNSEMAEEELRIRLDLFKEMEIDEWDFSAYDRVRDFADVIVPDAINIVDYVEMTDDFHLAGKHLTAIWEKLGKGIGIVAMQKKLGQPLAKGAEATMDRSRLYLSISEGRMKIVKGKNPASEKVNPNGLSVKFRLQAGAYFIPVSEWERSEES